MSEAYVTKKVKTHLMLLQSELGKAFCYLKISDRFTSGIPDYYICYKGFSLWLELKDAGAIPRPIQRYMLGRLKRAGCMTQVADSAIDAIIAIDEFVSDCEKIKLEITST